MTVWKRLVNRVLRGMGRRLWGFPPRIIPVVVDQLGAFSALWWLWANMVEYEKTRTELGPLRTHLLVTGISLLHGSSYCAYGHARALQLVYFDRFGRLFPVDEHELVEQCGTDDFAMRMYMRRALKEAGLAEEIPTFDRMVALVTGDAIGELPGDGRIQHLVKMFAFLTQCGIRGSVAPDGAHDPIARDSALVERYGRARNEQRTSIRVAA